MKSFLSSSVGNSSGGSSSSPFTQRMVQQQQRRTLTPTSLSRVTSPPMSSSYSGGSSPSSSTLRSLLFASSTSSTNGTKTSTLSSSSSPSSSLSGSTNMSSSSTTSSSTSDTLVVVEGFLTKQGQRFKTWKRRWCVVIATDNGGGTNNNTAPDDPTQSTTSTFSNEGPRARLYYAKQPESRNPRGEVTLDQFSVLDISTGTSLDEEAVALQSSDLLPTPYCFCINTQKRVYYFCCDTADDLARWQAALQSLLPQHRRLDAKKRQSRLERDVRQLFTNLQEAIQEVYSLDRREEENRTAGSQREDSHGLASPAERTLSSEDAAAARPGETAKREEEREWLRVIEAEIKQAETIEEEEERREEWLRIRQVLTKRMERAVRTVDRLRAALTLREAASRAAVLKASMDAAGNEKLMLKKSGKRRDHHDEVDDDEEDDGWNSDGFDTSREATMAREIMGKRSDNDEDEDDDDGHEGGGGEKGDEDVEEEEDRLLDADRLGRRRRSRRDNNGTRRVYSYGKADEPFEGEPETERTDDGGAYGTYPRHRHHHHHAPSSPPSTTSSFWCCFSC